MLSQIITKCKYFFIKVKNILTKIKKVVDKATNVCYHKSNKKERSIEYEFST